MAGKRKIFIIGDGAALRDARKAAGMNQQELANAIGVAHSVQICNYEQGKGAPRYDRAQQIAEALKVPAEQIFTGMPEVGGETAKAETPAQGFATAEPAKA